MTDPVGNGLALARIAAAIIIAEEQRKFMRAQIRMAEYYLEYYKEQRQFYRNFYRPMVEERLRIDATDPVFTPEYVARYGAVSNASLDSIIGFSRLVFGNNGATSPSESWLHRHAAMYALPSQQEVQLLNYIDLGIRATHVDLENYRYRHEEHKEQIYKQRRFDRLMNVAEYSNKSGVAAARDGAASFGFVSSALENKANMYGAMANDMFASAGNIFQSNKGGPKQHYNYPVHPDMGKYNPTESYSVGLEQQLKRPFWESPVGPVLK